MSTKVKILVPFEEFMNSFEDMLINLKLIGNNEFLVYADVGGFYVHPTGMMEVECELEQEDPELPLTRDPPAVEVIDEP